VGEQTNNWVPVRCASCGTIVEAAKDGEDARGRDGAQGGSLFVDRAREDVVGFEGVPGDE
jgi:hypothetical protein